MMSSKNTPTRTKILQASLELLEAGQGAEVRMSDIAKRAGISRQALYLHFATRTELLVETTLFVDDLKGADKRLAPSRAAKTGIERLEAFVEAWGGYMPEIYGVGLDAKGKLQPGIRKQAEQVFRNILACLKDGGMAKKDLVKFTVFLTDSRHIAEYRAARKKVIGDATVPASPLLIVNGLASPDMLIEIEATAAKG